MGILYESELRELLRQKTVRITGARRQFLVTLPRSSSQNDWIAAVAPKKKKKKKKAAISGSL